MFSSGYKYCNEIIKKREMAQMIEILSALFFVVGFYDFIVLNIILIRKNTLTHVFLRSNI